MDTRIEIQTDQKALKEHQNRINITLAKAVLAGWQAQGYISVATQISAGEALERRYG